MSKDNMTTTKGMFKVQDITFRNARNQDDVERERVQVEARYRVCNLHERISACREPNKAHYDDDRQMPFKSLCHLSPLKAICQAYVGYVASKWNCPTFLLLVLSC